MSIEIKKFGKIKEALIETNGLTVIAGHNDTGKSTIGKLLYSIIKSQISFPDLYDKLTNKKTLQELLNPFFELISDLDIKENNSLLEKLSAVRFNLYSSLYGNEVDDNLPNKIFNIIDECKTKYTLKESAISTLAQIKKKYKQEADDTQKFRLIVEYFLNDTFNNNLNNSVTKDPAEISYNYKEITISNIKIENDSIASAFFAKKHRFISYVDSVFIDSPMYLEKGHNSKTAYVADLKNKIEQAQAKLSNSNDTNITTTILDILDHAIFSYNESFNELEYTVQKDAKALKISNIASGSKSFGILYLLLKTEIIKKDTLIILDEPENHLHPEWQILYANILVALVSDGYHILLSSHSPTFIQALSYYTNQLNVEKSKVNFYLAKKIDNENYSNISNVSDDIDKIFNNLLSPNDIFYRW